ncbi:MAG: TonB-dependent receptor [Sulfurimicrobium sp.]|nr:TonB-dependent receptor [Sulfurimicrobium sp.]
MQASFRFKPDHGMAPGSKLASLFPLRPFERIFGSFFLALSLLLATTITAQAAELPVFASNEQAYLTALPIVLTPSRLPQPLNEAPAAMTVIDRDMIRASGYRDIPRLLRLVPGMQVGQERGGTHWVTYHGLGNDFPSWMQVLVDGRSVYSPGNFDGVDWAALPVAIDEIDRIEVVRGTDSAAYGSNAFLGVINIITRHSADDSGAKVSARAGAAAIGDVGLELGDASGTGSLRLNAAYKQDAGFDGLHDGKRSTLVSLRTDRRISNHDEIMFRMAASNGSRELGYPDSIFNNNGERGSDTLNATLHLQWRHTPTPGEEWLLHYYRNQDRTHEEWAASAPAYGIGAVPLNRNRSSVRDNLELQHRLTLSGTLRAVWGMEAHHDRVEAPFLYYGNANQSSDLARLFGQTEWWFRPDWSFNASAQAEKFDSDALHISPRLFANWKFTPQDTLRFGYAHAWRPPTLFERYGDVRAMYQGTLLAQPYLPNPDLQPAHIDSLEIGYLSQVKTWNTRLDARLFNERVNHYITRFSQPGFNAPLLSAILPSARYENLTTPITLRGLEYQIDSRPLPGTQLLLSHTLIDRSCNDASVTQLTAPYSASLSWLQDWGKKWSSTLTLLRMGPMAGGTGFVPAGPYVSRPYTTLDARIAHTAKFGGTPLEIALVGTNLGGRHQEIADRSEQFLHAANPANRTSPMLWLTFAIHSK